MAAAMVLEWSFSPPDFFEEAFSFQHDGKTVEITHGIATAEIDAASFEAKQGVREELHEALNARFRGVQLATHNGCVLTLPKLSRLHPDGRRDLFLEVKTLHINVSAGRVDVRVTDKDGKTVTDTRRERIQGKMSFANQVAKHLPGNRVLRSLLDSQAASIADPRSELVHLYEIRDALSAEFGGEKKAKQILGLSRSQWSEFGKLCNEEPFSQGRHRGKNSQTLRDATESELVKARDLARAMVKAYLDYLDGNP